MALTLGVLVAGSGCALGSSEQDEKGEIPTSAVQAESAARAGGTVSPQGLSMNGLSQNGISQNGLSQNGLSQNGISALALSSTALAANTKFSSWFEANRALGDEVMTYVARCALGPNERVTYRAPDGASFTWAGSLGVAASWGTGPLAAADQEIVSACLMAHVNETGRHVEISVRGRDPALAASTTGDEARRFAYREGAFYGNLFTSPPVMRVCSGNVLLQSMLIGPTGRMCTIPGNCGFTWDGDCDLICAKAEVAPADDPSTTYPVYARCGGTAHVATTYLAL